MHHIKFFQVSSNFLSGLFLLLPLPGFEHPKSLEQFSNRNTLISPMKALKDLFRSHKISQCSVCSKQLFIFTLSTCETIVEEDQRQHHSPVGPSENQKICIRHMYEEEKSIH